MNDKVTLMDFAKYTLQKMRRYNNKSCPMFLMVKNR